jgi:hypothetical protein
MKHAARRQVSTGPRIKAFADHDQTVIAGRTFSSAGCAGPRRSPAPSNLVNPRMETACHDTTIGRAGLGAWRPAWPPRW